ncbi:hypothetical protein [Portibacter marinus]|uniref:hypothetical protein n=1 Tax=Portibacter marinus TaxID=2898660 RepID=UPI001F3CD0E7|nr:hypothetical protein [Portibacter marinus]
MLLLFSAVNECKQSTTSRIQIIEPSIEQEATSIWRTINDITFLESQGYTIHLPDDPLIDNLINKSKEGNFGNDDYAEIYRLLEAKIYDRSKYKNAIQKVEGQLALLNRMMDKVEVKLSGWNWNFKTFDQYKIQFTLYGTGGSYDPDEGVITLWTNQQGEFMNYNNPANTIIHEITHIGMEESLVHKYDLPHGLKERTVDRFVYLLFKEDLPEYRIQEMGDARLDELLNDKEAIKHIDEILLEILDEQ